MRRVLLACPVALCLFALSLPMQLGAQAKLTPIDEPGYTKLVASHRFLEEPRGDHVLGVAIDPTAKAGQGQAVIVVTGPRGTTRTFRAQVTIPKV